MELKRALELNTEYAGHSGIIRIDIDGYICLNEMVAFFPNKSLNEWMKNKTTAEFIEIAKKNIIGDFPPIITRRGKGGGTWSIPILAFEFATWLSAEFKYKIFSEYIRGTQHKQDWNIKRILAANNYRLMCDAIKGDHEPAKPYHFSNEALMLNEIVFHSRESTARDGASEELLDDIAELEADNSTMIKLGMDYQARKAKLEELYAKKHNRIMLQIT